MNTNIITKKVDFTDTKQRLDLGELLIEYSLDIMGGGEALSNATVDRSIALLSKKDYAVSFLAYCNHQPIGFSNCFENIATFKGKTAINIHDLAVIPSFRNMGVGTKLLQAIEEYARDNDMAKMTLEVLEGNKPALSAYTKFGFQGYQLDPSMGNAIFWQKMLAK